jgi:hypothetical protein
MLVDTRPVDEQALLNVEGAIQEACVRYETTPALLAPNMRDWAFDGNAIHDDGTICREITMAQYQSLCEGLTIWGAEQSKAIENGNRQMAAMGVSEEEVPF